MIVYTIIAIIASQRQIYTPGYRLNKPVKFIIRGRVSLVLFFILIFQPTNPHIFVAVFFKHCKTCQAHCV